MPENRDEDAGFLTRWSRRKRGVETADAEPNAVVAPQPPAQQPPGAQADTTAQTDQARLENGDEVEADDEARDTRFDDFDFDSLDASSDYQQFMQADVPDEVRNQALSRLWTSDPIFSNLDGLTDYSEDFTDAALVPVGALKTAYKVGQGFLSDEEVAEWEALGREDSASPDADEATHAATGMAGANHPMPVSINIEPPDQPDVATMFAASDAYSNGLYPAESNHPVTPAQVIAGGGVFLVARTGEGTAVGCGAVLCATDGTAEIKRMWVDPTVRRGGVGRQLLGQLLTEAQARKTRVVRLETGFKQPEAIGLYESAGFERRGPFGTYSDDLNSVFMELEIPEVEPIDDDDLGDDLDD